MEEQIENVKQSTRDKEAIEQFTEAIKEMSTQAQLDSMTSTFKDEGKAFGLSDDESKEMQDYAKYLSEISKESDDLSNNLATDAEASADVAIQITKMNKGIEELAEGFSEWNNILKKSYTLTG